MPTSFRKLLLACTLLILTSISYSQNKKEQLIVFHFDFNSVSLNKDYVLKWLDKISRMGYNAVLWEIEDDVLWETCPESVSKDAFSKKEFKEIINHSRTLGLEPIPLLQTIGHAEYVLQHAPYYRFREDPSRYDCYCTSNIEVKDFLKKWIDEYLEVFGSVKYFHLGGDEAYAFATCNKCKDASDKLGKNGLYAEYLNDISKPLLEKGIRPGIWGDMILSHPEQIDVISKDFVIWDWNYWDGDSIPEKVMVWGKGRLPKENISSEMLEKIPFVLDENQNLNPFYTSDYLKHKGYDVILCSSSRCYGDAVFVGRNDLHINNIIGAARKTSKLNLLGTCVTSWAVRIPNYETQETWLYFAPLTLKNPLLSKEILLEKDLQYFFDYTDTKLSRAFERISYSFPFTNNNTTGIMWTGLKDSKPAPANYIKGLISKWKKNNQWSEIEKLVSKSTDEISSGMNELLDVIPKVNKGYEILQNWTQAAYFQYWQSILANKIIQKENYTSKFDSKEVVQQIKNLKNQFASWANNWMTRESTMINASLIYDAFIDYFGKP